MHVPNFKMNPMYDRAMDLLYVIYNETANLDQEQALLLRKRVVIIIKKITRAIVEINGKMKMKLLNEAKDQLLAVLDESYEMYQEGLIDGYMIDNFAEQLLKLIHYQFGKMKKSGEEHKLAQQVNALIISTLISYGTFRNNHWND